jgi:serine/threonine protein kinase
MFENFIGLVLGDRYEIQDLLGSGGTALVYAAHDRKSDRQVAVKFVKPEYAWSLDIINALIDEARIIAKLEHPNILNIYDQGTQDVKGQRLVYLVMQLASGGTLADRLAAGALTLYEADGILKQICDALDYAHSREVLHLDLKPLNVLFDEQGHVLVADFGLAKLLRGASRVKADTGLGTPIYMPPEQYFGHKAGPFSDVYTVGVTLYQMLTGELPEQDWTDPLLPLLLGHPLPPGIRSVIEKATQHAPNQRYRTPRELAQAFTVAIAPVPFAPYEWDTGVDESEPDVLLWKEPEEVPVTGKSPPSKKSWIPQVVTGLAALTIMVSLAVFGAVQRRWERRAEATLAAISLILTVSPTDAAALTVTLSPSPMPTPSSNATLTPVSSPVPYLVVPAERLVVYTGPGEDYEERGEVRRGDRLPLCGRLADGTWWQVVYLGKEGWIPPQPVGANVDPRVLPVVELPPPPKRTRTPTPEPTPTPVGPNTVLRLENPGFEGIQENFIPGWQWGAEDNYGDGEEYVPATSFDTPLFTQAKDPARVINGPTLQMEATAFVNFRAYVRQTVSAPPAVTVRFQASAQAYSNSGGIRMAAGLDPDGGSDCSQARWGDELTIDQSWGTVQLFAPDVAVGKGGRVTVCLWAENVNPGRSNAAYFDNAALIANPE